MFDLPRMSPFFISDLRAHLDVVPSAFARTSIPHHANGIVGSVVRRGRPHAAPVARRGDRRNLLETPARGLARLIAEVDPIAIVLDGGLSNIEWIDKQGPSRIARYLFNGHLCMPILRSRLGDSAGVVSAALRTIRQGG